MYRLEQRARLGYNVIQLVGTQWRGCDQNSEGQVAFTGSGRITINPAFFQYFDEKMDRVNAHGHVAGLVLLWALPFGRGMELSPGYYLPDREAILLARYMVARYGAHHVTWILGGDGKYFDELEDRWKYIGQEVFWDKAIELPGSRQIGMLGAFMRGFDWWNLLPAQELLLEQPGEENYKHHLSVLKSKDQEVILVYIPAAKLEVSLLLPPGKQYRYQWFDPVTGKTSDAEVQIEKRVMNVQNPLEKDTVLLAITVY